jgi:hypothetical protein
MLGQGVLELFFAQEVALEEEASERRLRVSLFRRDSHAGVESIEHRLSSFAAGTLPQNIWSRRRSVVQKRVRAATC